MRLLLDTHAFIWWLLRSRNLTNRARAAIAEPANSVAISAASAWEITTKFRLGQLPPGAAGMASDVTAQVAAEGFLELSVSVRHGQHAGALPGPHKDPFDRMLIAQAMLEGLTLVSNEIVFDRYGVVRLW